MLTLNYDDGIVPLKVNDGNYDIFEAINKFEEYKTS